MEFEVALCAIQNILLDAIILRILLFIEDERDLRII